MLPHMLDQAAGWIELFNENSFILLVDRPSNSANIFQRFVDVSLLYFCCFAFMVYLGNIFVSVLTSINRNNCKSDCSKVSTNTLYVCGCVVY